jgi:hypothetical protein
MDVISGRTHKNYVHGVVLPHCGIAILLIVFRLHFFCKGSPAALGDVRE